MWEHTKIKNSRFEKPSEEIISLEKRLEKNY